MTDTTAPVLGEATVQELREGVRGEVLGRQDPGYAEACRVWNAAHDGRRPALVVRCAGAADVVAAIGFARGNDLPVAVRGGGHSIAGFSTCDDGVVIDLSPMRGVRVDPAARIAYVGPGAVWGDVDHETQAHGLATTGGLISTTGVAGFTLGGGIGWLMRRHVHADAPHLREVDHDPAVDGRKAGDAVAAAAHGDRQVVAAREAEGGDNVRNARCLDDEGGTAVLVQPVPGRACFVVSLVLGGDDRSADRLPQLLERCLAEDGCECLGHL